jgi:DNA-binding NtrC family response regulator
VSSRARILVVDDEPRAVELVARALRKLGQVECAPSGDEAWRLARRVDFDLVISDQRMPGMSGVELLTRIAKKSLHTGRILLTAYEELGSTIAAINQGRIHAYLSKPCPPAEIRETVRSVLELVQQYRTSSTPLLGTSRAMRELQERVGQAAPGRFPVLILGETGTGKELVARSLHDQSPRAARPFVAVNCGALPEALLESELFGHQQGAFTGAHRDKPGLFDLADGGTLFLDEIGDTSAAMQVRLLRVLEDQEVRSVGGSETRKIDVRLVSATHRDIEAMVKAGDFRQDLFYRINTITLQVPPLGARRDDIAALAQHFAQECAAMSGRQVTLEDGFLAALAQRDFPGNVRELRSVVERAIALAAPGSVARAQHLETGEERAAEPQRAGGHTLRERVEALQVQTIRETLERFEGNRTRAADFLGLSRPGLTKMMRRLGLEESSHR